jgi:hypothetical protein
MPETIELLSKAREQQLARAREDRELLASQVKQQDLVDEYHQEIRIAADELGRKAIALELSVDLSTVSNWLSCEPGRGFPPPKLLLLLRRRSHRLATWEAVQADYVPPQRVQQLTAEQELSRIKEALAANPDVQAAVYQRAFGGRR